MSVPRRHGRSKANRPFVVDGREYLVSISDGGFDAEDRVIVRITFRARAGGGVCLVRGITNRSFWMDYPFDVQKWRAKVISITPRVLCELIRLVHRKGWEPQKSRANFELVVDRETAGALCPTEISSHER